ncbi:MAG: RluA family pseudouridine synthase [Candidatus Omnitrophica bacterium]|nr:RluA family pseudouridine synthase [Candidatus Omnitrophota bacterium]
MSEYRLKVSCEENGRRLDLFLFDSLNKERPGLSRTSIKKIIQEGRVVSENFRSPKPHQKVKAGDRIRVVIEDKEPSLLKPEEISLDVVYEDDDLAVINKPVGLVVHPAAGNQEHTLVNALLHRFKNLSGINPLRPGIVHRLDKETSGLLVIAKNNPSHLNLAAQFAKHTIKRKYIAIVKGKVEFDQDVIEAPIARHTFKRKNMAVSFLGNAKYAKTHYRTLKRFADFSLLELEPFTGRTHQLRVHLDFIGHPILGDNKYGRNNEFKRLCLHAKYIGFIHPASGKFIEFDSAVPKEFGALLKHKKS